MQDLRHALRLLRKNPGFTAIAVLALALGIGANTAIFSVVDAVLLQQLPYQDPDRIAMVWEDVSWAGFPRNTPAPANWVDWRKQNTVFTDIAASAGRSANLTGDGPPEFILGRRTTANFWAVLGARPLMGRTFTDEEDQKVAKVVVISYSLWQRRFGGDPKIIGRKIILSDEPFEVIGVMPSGFVFPSRLTDIWTPASMTPQELSRRGSHYLQCVARLKPGVSMAQAQSEMSVIAKRLGEQYPDENRRVGAVVVSLRENLVGNTKLALIVLLVAAGCVLLIACANLANLLLARAAGRRQEMAVRAALGAGRGRIIRQMLTESLLLAAGGAILGLAFARLGMIVLEKLIPNGLALPKLSLDWRVLAFTAGIAVLTGILFGLAPALAMSRTELHDTLKQGGRGSAGTRRHWLRDALVVSEVALALLLLTGAGLMIQTLRNLENVDIGMRRDHLLTLGTDLPRSRYPDFPKRNAFFRAVLDKIRTIPGVTSVAYTSNLPLTAFGNTSGYTLEGETRGDGRAQDALFRVVTPGFFQTIGASLREGRLFTDDDRANTTPVMVINETFANLHWPGQSPIGKRFHVSFNTTKLDDRRWLTIIGVVKEIRERGIDAELKQAMYMPEAQSELYWPIPSDLAIRTSIDPLTITSAVREAIWAVDKDQPIARVRSMEQVSERQLEARQQQMTLLTAFAGLALILASLGIYGVLSYAVAQRTQEIGVRMSLGATPQSIVGLVLNRGLLLTALGLAIGVIGSIVAGRLIKTMLFGVKEQDPVTLVGVSVILLAVAATACLLPAWRASRVDPVIALQNE